MKLKKYIILILTSFNFIGLQCLGPDEKQLFEYAREGGPEAAAGIKSLLNEKVNVNAQDQNGNTALYWAAFGGHKDIVELLLPLSKVNIQNKIGDTALLAATQNGNKEVVDLLIDKADPNMTDSVGTNALMLASAAGHTELI